MTDLVVHGIPGSPYVRTVLLALEEKGLAWQFAARGLGANYAPDYAAIHPFRKIPTLDHGAFRLYETHAILRYLDRLAPAPPLVPADPQAAARMDQLIAITSHYVTPRISSAVSFPVCIAPIFGRSVDRAAVEAALPAAAETLAEVARLLGDQPFIVGDDLTLADLMLAPHLAFLPDYEEGRALLRDQPRLAAWLARMEARPSMAATGWERLIELTGVDTRTPIAA